MSQPIEQVLSALCAQADTPRSLAVKLLIEHGEYRQLVNLTTDPSRYTSAYSYALDNAVTEFLRKYEGLKTGIDTKKVAADGFYTAERQCFRTNQRLRDCFVRASEPQNLRIIKFLDDVRKFVAEVLGPLPRELTMPSFGPGATFADKGHLVTIPDKMCSRPTVTSSARDLLPFWWRTSWARELVRTYSYRSDPAVVRGNRFTTVPKDATKDRGIAIEPSINVFYQLGVGKLIRSRLKRIGIDLEEGQAIHVQAARDASLTRSASTIDLSSASDTVSTELVKAIVPTQWYELLSTLRSPYTQMASGWHLLEKFSSMGNGFTFELETLVFLAICCISMRECGIAPIPGVNVLVYGDDLIVPREATRAVLAALTYCGFTPNQRKTFTTDVPFRESCGGDFFAGTPVRAHYVKEDPCEPQHWISIANGLRRLGSNLGWFGPGTVCWRPWLIALDQIPSRIRRIRGPEILGDLVIHDEAHRWATFTDPNRPWVLFHEVYRPVSRLIDWKHWHASTQLAAALYGCSSNGVSPRKADEVGGYRIGRWPSFEGD